MKRIVSCVGAATIGALAWGTLAFAGGHAPSITPNEATFVIGPGGVKGTVWTLNLWSKGNRVGSTSGTTGTLIVAVPATPSCSFQADVLRNGKWFSGNDANLTSCGGVSPTTSTTTSTTTTTKPPTSSKGGHKPKSGHTPVVNKLVASGTPTPITKSAQGAGSPTPVSSSKLAFTGAGPGLWILALIGSGLLVTGGGLLLRRPRFRR
jgi:hypothetical protein